MRHYLKDSEIADALRDGKGFLAEAARRLGVTRQAIAHRVRKSAFLSAVEAECVETNTDIAESRLVAAIDEGAGWAIKFYLQCKGTERGYHFPSAVAVVDDAPEPHERRSVEELERRMQERGWYRKGGADAG